MSRDDGGPAYPLQEKNADGSHYFSHPGMTLRDWFAGQAAPAAFEMWSSQRDGILIAAASAYEMADAMLEARRLAVSAVPSPNVKGE